MLIGELMLRGVAVGCYIAMPIIVLWVTILAIREQDILGILLATFGWFLFIVMTLVILGV